MTCSMYAARICWWYRFGKYVTSRWYRGRTDELEDQKNSTRIKCDDADCKIVPFSMTNEDFQMQSGSCHLKKIKTVGGGRHGYKKNHKMNISYGWDLAREKANAILGASGKVFPWRAKKMLTSLNAAQLTAHPEYWSLSIQENECWISVGIRTLKDDLLPDLLSL